MPHDLRAAIEAALGYALSALIVDSVEDVPAVLSRLRAGDIGRVAFLPLSLASSSGGAPPVPASLASDPAISGRAADLIRITGDHSAAIRALLEGVLVVRDMESAVRVRPAGYPGCIVTRAGEILWPPGLFTTGGHQGSRGHLVGRAEEIEQAQTSLAHLDQGAEEHARLVEVASERLREIEAAATAAAVSVDREGEARADLLRRMTLQDA